jgi:hypothetical protein
MHVQAFKVYFIEIDNINYYKLKCLYVKKIYKNIQREMRPDAKKTTYINYIYLLDYILI